MSHVESVVKFQRMHIASFVRQLLSCQSLYILLYFVRPWTKKQLKKMNPVVFVVVTTRKYTPGQDPSKPPG